MACSNKLVDDASNFEENLTKELIIEKWQLLKEEAKGLIHLESLFERIESKFDSIENDIEVRIESLKTDIENLHEIFDNEISLRETNCIEVLKSEDIMFESQKKLTDICKRLQQINYFKESEYLIDISSVGEINQPRSFHCLTNIKSNKIIKFEDKYDIKHAVYLRRKNKLVLNAHLKTTTKTGKFVYTYDNMAKKPHLKKIKQPLIETKYHTHKILIANLKTNLIEEFLDERINDPLKLCVRKNDELFVTQIKTITSSKDGNKIEVFEILRFDDNMNFKRSIEIIRHKNISEFDEMLVDLYETKCVKNENNFKINGYSTLIYLSHNSRDKVTIWDSESGVLVNKINLKSPRYMQTNKDFLYVTMENQYICIFDKTNYGLVRKLEIKSSFGFCVDIFENVFYLKLGYQGLVLYNQTEYLTRLLDTNGTRGINSTCFFENKLFICYDSLVRIFEFDF